MEKKILVGLASDHAGFPLKQFVKQYLEEKGIEYKDYGTYSDMSCDYPDFAHPLAEDIEAGVVSTGIGICGSGEGMAMTLNNQHNNANALVLPGRFITNQEAAAIIDEYLNTPFEAGRHQLRIDKM